VSARGLGPSTRGVAAAVLLTLLAFLGFGAVAALG
jgi:amino acid transporter